MVVFEFWLFILDIICVFLFWCNLIKLIIIWEIFVIKRVIIVILLICLIIGIKFGEILKGFNI